jgi:spermidine synthase
MSDLPTEIFYPESETLFSAREGNDDIRVVQQGSVRHLFIGQGLAHHQGSVDMSDPTRHVNMFSEMSMHALRFVPEPEKALFVGLGTGTMPMCLSRHVPGAEMEILEISPVVLDLARRYFLFEDGKNIRVRIGDAFTTMQGVQKESVDMVFLDGFGTSYVPIQLMCREFMDFVAGTLKDKAVVAVNILPPHVSFPRHMRTMLDSFGDDLYWLECGEDVQNTIMFFAKESLGPIYNLPFDDRGVAPERYPAIDEFRDKKPFKLGK